MYILFGIRMLCLIGHFLGTVDCLLREPELPDNQYTTVPSPPRKMAASSPAVVLNDGYRIPAVGYGVWDHVSVLFEFLLLFFAFVLLCV